MVNLICQKSVCANVLTQTHCALVHCQVSMPFDSTERNCFTGACVGANDNFMLI